MKCIVTEFGIFTLENMNSITIDDVGEDWQVTLDYRDNHLVVSLYKHHNKKRCKDLLEEISRQMVSEDKDVIDISYYHGKE